MQQKAGESHSIILEYVSTAACWFSTTGGVFGSGFKWSLPARWLDQWSRYRQRPVYLRVFQLPVRCCPRSLHSLRWDRSGQPSVWGITQIAQQRFLAFWAPCPAIRRPSELNDPREQQSCALRFPALSTGIPPRPAWMTDDRAPPLPVSLPCRGQMWSLSGQRRVTYKHGMWYTFHKASGLTDYFVRWRECGKRFFHLAVRPNVLVCSICSADMVDKVVPVSPERKTVLPS